MKIFYLFLVFSVLFGPVSAFGVNGEGESTLSIDGIGFSEIIMERMENLSNLATEEVEKRQRIIEEEVEKRKDNLFSRIKDSVTAFLEEVIESVVGGIREFLNF